MLVLRGGRDFRHYPTTGTNVFQIFLRRSVGFLGRLIPVVGGHDRQGFLLMRPFSLIIRPVVGYYRGFYTNLLTRFRPTCTIASRHGCGFIPLELSTLRRGRKILVHFFFPSVQVVYKAGFRNSFPTFSTMFVFGFGGGHLFPFI